MVEKSRMGEGHSGERYCVLYLASFIVLWIQLRDARESFIKQQRPYIWVFRSEKPVCVGRDRCPNAGELPLPPRCPNSPRLQRRLH